MTRKWKTKQTAKKDLKRKKTYMLTPGMNHDMLVQNCFSETMHTPSPFPTRLLHFLNVTPMSGSWRMHNLFSLCGMPQQLMHPPIFVLEKRFSLIVACNLYFCSTSLIGNILHLYSSKYGLCIYTPMQKIDRLCTALLLQGTKCMWC